MQHLIPFLLTLTMFLAPDARAATPRITVDLALHPPAPATTQPAFPSFTLTLHNPTDQPLTVDHPSNRMTLTLILLNSLGNIVPPTDLAKIDLVTAQITLPPRSSHKHTLDRLEFLTGSALFGYTLTPGETYRLIALYRPNGPDSPAIASPERTFIAPGHDPISRLVDKLSGTHGLWINGMSPILDLPAASSTDEVLTRVFEMTGFDAGQVTAHTLRTVRDVRISIGPVAETYTAALVTTNLGAKIVLLRHEGKTLGWWSRVYDADLPTPTP